jgi:RNA polymerase sigma factor (sigma-70 family)
MNQPLDSTLAAAARGDEYAWRQLIDAYSGRVYGLLFRQCGNAELSEEITQATFVKVVTKLGDYEDTGRFESWLFRIAMNRLRDEMRRRKRQANPVDFAATPAGIDWILRRVGPVARSAADGK